MLIKFLLVCCIWWWNIVAGSYNSNNNDKEHRDWEIAVVINDRIVLLQSNGTLIGSTVEQFTKLKALTFDAIRHQFVVSDMDQANDTIFTVELTKETEIVPIIPDLPDDVQGLAIDPIEDVLYWTDSVNRTINYIRLNETGSEPHLLFAFSDKIPKDIAIDVCRRYIYWTNSDVHHPTIERATLNGSHHEILIDTDLSLPSGIAIDYKTQRLYWGDMREGIYYRIDSANLNGHDREIIYEGTHSKPFSIAVDETSVYWTDVNNNALWRYFKKDKGSTPEIIKEFDEIPMGIITKNIQIRSYPDCKELEVAIEKYAGVTEEFFENISEVKSNAVLECLNGGELKEGGSCRCRNGFVGQYCEINNCHNYCIHGTCQLSVIGYPHCHCWKGFGGSRCELDMCNKYCLNGGVCSYVSGDVVPSCRCPKHTTGDRCEISTEFKNLCLMYCRESIEKNDFLISRSRDLICRCENHSYIISKNNMTSSYLYPRLGLANDSLLWDNYTTDTKFIVMVLISSISVISVIVLSVCLIMKRRKRPLVKKRIIVNKNVTPLTYRPHQTATEHCEITIENCCNMNVCETPCFEPPGFREKLHAEDRKTLLSEMENGCEDTY